MANYNKSFNFRNGVQVDNNNFVVNANGLVGIGTTIPQEYLLNVYGDTRITGLVTAKNLNTTNLNSTGIATVGFLTATNIQVSGAVTATTFYGSAAGLTGIYGIAINGWVVSGNNISTTSNIGVGTESPEFIFQVGTNPLVTSSGIGINSNGNVYSAGIVTASSFTGNGSNLTALNASNIASGTLSTSFFPSSITLSGIITASSFIGNGSGLTSINANNISSGTLNNSRLPSNINVSGVITATTFVGNLTGTATTASNLVSTANISVNSVNSGFTTTGIATITKALYVVGSPGKIGVGTITEPEADIEVNKAGISSIRVISSNNVSTIGIGRSAEIRTGNLNSLYSYSTPSSLDIINSTEGNINYYLDYGTAGLGTGSFHWIYGQNPSTPLMSLLYNGNFGIGTTNPQSKFYVVGNSYITGITTINNNLTVNGNLTFTGSVTGNLGITTFSRLGIATNTILNNAYDFFVGQDPIIGDGVAISEGDFHASGNITASSVNATNVDVVNINSTGTITAGTFMGLLVGTATTANSINGERIDVLYANVSNSVGIGTTIPTSTLDVVGNVKISGVTTSVDGFTSGIGVTNPVKITVTGNVLTFTVVGVGSTSLTLY